MRKTVSSIILLLVLALVGCSGSGDTPVSSVNPEGSHGFLSDNSVPIIALSDADDAFSAVGLMGAYDLTIDTSTMDVQLVSKRTSTVGESYIVNGLAYWTIAPCPNCLSIQEYVINTDGLLIVTFTIDHPFPKGDTALPPTAANRLDLDIFDVAAVIAPSESSESVPITYSRLGADVFTDLCDSPDGFTRELENLFGEAAYASAALPYYLVVDESGLSTHTYNKFEMGTTGVEFDVRLKLTNRKVSGFEMYLTMAYGASARKAQRLEPKYFNPEFNRKAAWKVEVEPPVAPLTWIDNNSISSYNVKVKVYDWQHSSIASTVVPYEDEFETTKVYAQSRISSVQVEIPGMNNIVQTKLLPSSGTGAPDNPLIYDVLISNNNLLPAGEYLSLVKVLDSRAPGVSVVGGETDTMVSTPNGGALEWYNIPQFVTYQTFIATVRKSCGPITGTIVDPIIANYTTITGLSNTQLLDITVEADSAGLGHIVQYEADFDYDGETFSSDATSANGIFNDFGPIVVPGTCEDNVPYDFQIAFRATDNCTPPNQTIFATYYGRVEYCPAPPVGNLTLTVNRETTSGSTQYYQKIDVDGPNGPFTLNWTASPGAVEYAVYYDNNPGDYTEAQLTDNFIFVGTAPSSATSFQVPASHYTSVNGYIPGNTYMVKSRSEVGVPESESVNNEIAYVMVTAFNTLRGNDTFGYPNGTGNTEGWKIGKQNSQWYTSNYQYVYPYVETSSSYYCSAPNALRFGALYLGYNITQATYPGKWMSMTIEAPFIDGEEHREIEGMVSLQYSYYNYPDVGTMVGECSSQPGLSWDGADWTILQVKSGAQYLDYNWLVTPIWPFDDTAVAGVNNAWQVNNTSYPQTPRRIFGADFTEKYVGLCMYSNYGNSIYNYIFFDDISIVVY